jgi:hypothetical protein
MHDTTATTAPQKLTGTGMIQRSSDIVAPHPGHWYECHLEVVGTGVTPAGDGMVDYSGECSRRGR